MLSMGFVGLFGLLVVLFLSQAHAHARSLDLTARSSAGKVLAGSTRRFQVLAGNDIVKGSRLRQKSIQARQQQSVQARQTVSVPLDNEVTFYLLNITLGTPPQDVTVRIDTGSSDLWVNVDTSTFCVRYPGPCEAYGVYNPDASSSFNRVNERFDITYADGSMASGPYVTDTLGVESADISAFQFGLANQSTYSAGILGIGYMSNEAAAEDGANALYPNLPRALVDAGHINTMAYSLWLDDLQSDQGNILFGGVDSDKYQGELVTLPIIRQYSYYSAFYIALTGIGTGGQTDSIASGIDLPVLLDSGTTLSYLPDAMANQLFEAYGLTYDNNAGAAPIDCGASGSSSVDFSFGSLTISVPMSELIIDLSTDPRNPECAFGIAPVGGADYGILGDTFLRSAYVVYDLTNNQISMATTNFDSTSENIQAIASGTDGIPRATTEADAQSTATRPITGTVNDGLVTSVGSYISAQTITSTPSGVIIVSGTRTPSTAASTTADSSSGFSTSAGNDSTSPTSAASSLSSSASTSPSPSTNTASDNSGNAALPMVTLAPVWKYSGPLAAAGAAALALL